MESRFHGVELLLESLYELLLGDGELFEFLFLDVEVTL